MELHQLRYMMAVAEYQSFTKAAEEINVSQSSLSTQISKLEAELGTRLFERGSRSVSLTEAGKAFLPYATDICEKEEKSKESMRWFSAPDNGLLRLGSFPGAERYDFFSDLRKFKKEFPKVSIDFYEAEGTVLMDMLLNREIDAAFCGEPDVTEGACFYCLYEDRMALIVPSEHRLADKEAVSISDLKAKLLFFLSLAHSTRPSWRRLKSILKHLASKPT